MEKYERTIGLKTIWLTIIRRWKIILVIFIPTALASLVVTQFIIKKTYQSSATFLNNADLKSGHASIQHKMQKTDSENTIINKTVTNLASAEKPITISSADLLNGLSFTAYSTSSPYVFTFSFKSTNKSIVQPVVTELSKVALADLKADYANLDISSPASAPKDVSNGKKYLLIGLAAGAVLGLGIAFVDEIISDEVYDEDEILSLGSSSFGLIVTKK